MSKWSEIMPTSDNHHVASVDNSHDNLFITTIHHNINKLQPHNASYNKYYVNYANNGGADTIYNGTKWSEGCNGGKQREAGTPGSAEPGAWTCTIFYSHARREGGGWGVPGGVNRVRPHRYSPLIKAFSGESLCRYDRYRMEDMHCADVPGAPIALAGASKSRGKGQNRNFLNGSHFAYE